MAIDSTISYTATGGGTAISGITAASTGTEGIQISVSVPASTTNQAYPIAIDVSELTSVFLVTDGVLTLKTNSTGAPDDTIVFLTEDFPLAWSSGNPTIDGSDGNPFDADVTVFYLTNATGSAVLLQGFINQDL